MRNLKKLLAVVIAVAFLITAMAPAFAADSAKPVSDGIVDAKVKAAVDMLTAFKVVGGKEDGKYHPEQNLTRDEFAKMVVEALGLGSAAEAAKAPTKFSDVPADKWSTGYINVAVGQGIIKGRADGTFGPNDNVTYAEAATILVRALGYKDEFLPGSWPGNYFAKAADAKVTKDVKVSTSGFVDRGAAALMVRNTLDADIVRAKEYDSSNNATKFEKVDGRTLLKEKLDYDKVENVRFYDNYRLNSGYDKNEIGLKLLKVGDDMVIDGKTYKSDGDQYDKVVKVKVADTANVESLLGYQVKAYMDNDKVLYMEADESDTVVTDYVNEYSDDTNYKFHLKAKDVKLVANTDNEKTTVFVNGEEKSPSIATKKSSEDIDLTKAIKPGSFGRFVYNGSKLVWADLFDATYDAFVVTKVDNGIVTGISGKDKDEEINLKDNDNYDKVAVFSKDRTPLNVSDIKAGDVIYVVEQTIDNDDYAIVTVVKDNIVEGKLEEYGDDYAYVGSKKYDLTSNSNDKVLTAFTPNNYADVDWYKDKLGNGDSMEDVSGNDVKAYLDIAGTIRFFESNVKANSGDKYGIITDTFSDGDRIKIWTIDGNGEGDQYTYTLEESKNAKDGTNKKLNEGDLIKFKLNKNGEISENEIYKLGAKYDTSGNKHTYDNTDVFGYLSNDETGKTTVTTRTPKTDEAPAISRYTSTSNNNWDYPADWNADKIKNKTYKVSDDVLVINAPNANKTSFNKDDFEILKWQDIKDTGIGSGVPVAIFANDKYEAKALIFCGDGTTAGNDPEAAYVVAKFKKGDKYMAKVTIFDGDKEKDIEVTDSDSSYDYLVKETPYVIKLLGSGKIRVYAPNDTDSSVEKKAKDFVTVTGVVYDKDGDEFKLQLADGSWYKNDSNVGYKVADENKADFVRMVSKSVIYDGGDVKTKSNISNKKAVTVVLYQGTDARAIKIGAADYPSAAKSAGDRPDLIKEVK